MDGDVKNIIIKNMKFYYYYFIYKGIELIDESTFKPYLLFGILPVFSSIMLIFVKFDTKG